MAKEKATKRYVPVPDAERCEATDFGGWHRSRCTRRAKHTVLVHSERGPYPTFKLGGEQREVCICGVHRRQADKGKPLHIFAGMADDYIGTVKSREYYAEATDIEKLREQLRDAEMHQKWDRSKPSYARNAAGRAMFEQAPEILEMLFMVAERGDQRAWAAIETIQQGMSDVEKADAEYQALVDKIEALKAKIEQAKGEQAG